jgi:hypothetical protein
MKNFIDYSVHTPELIDPAATLSEPKTHFARAVWLGMGLLLALLTIKVNTPDLYLRIQRTGRREITLKGGVE